MELVITKILHDYGDGKVAQQVIAFCDEHTIDETIVTLMIEGKITEADITNQLISVSEKTDLCKNSVKLNKH